MKFCGLVCQVFIVRQLSLAVKQMVTGDIWCLQSLRTDYIFWGGVGTVIIPLDTTIIMRGNILGFNFRYTKFNHSYEMTVLKIKLNNLMRLVYIGVHLYLCFNKHRGFEFYLRVMGGPQERIILAMHIEYRATEFLTFMPKTRQYITTNKQGLFLCF